MSGLLHIHAEYTHPVPKLGSLLTLHLTTHFFNESTLQCWGQIHSHSASFKLPESVLIIPHIVDTKQKLLKYCSEISYEDDTKNRVSVFSFLKNMKQIHGNLIPTGYDMSATCSYLYDFLGKDIDLIDSRSLDINTIGMSLFRNLTMTESYLQASLPIPRQTFHNNQNQNVLTQRIHTLNTCFKMLQK